MITLDSSVIDGGATLVVASGRLDMVSAPDFKSLIASTVKDGSACVVVDLAGVKFMDSSGLGALISGLRVARQAGGRFLIAAATAQVRAVLQVTQVDQVLHPYPNVDDALRAA